MASSSRSVHAPPTTLAGKYELGETLGEGNFSVVRSARNIFTGESVAIKILDKQTLLAKNTMHLIVREISIMKRIRHPNVVRIYEVLASKTKIYIVMELVTGGELFDTIVSKGFLNETEARNYFQQLICAVDYCHSRNVYHRDLKPENLLLSADGMLKVSDFGLGALPEQLRKDGRLHTRCGTSHYMAPEVIQSGGYEGAKADIWSCGVVLFVLMAGHVPFDDANLMELYQKIIKAEFTCPPYFSSSVKRLVNRILDPNPATRITINEIFEHEWFKKGGYKPPRFSQEIFSFDEASTSTSLGEEIDSPTLVEQRREAPVTMNAFEILSSPLGFNIVGNLINQEPVKREARFIFQCSANEIVSRIMEAAVSLGFNVNNRNYKLRIRGENAGRKGHLSIATEIFLMAEPFHLVELRKAEGDTLEFQKFHKDISTGLKDIIWKSERIDGQSQTDGASTSTAR